MLTLGYFCATLVSILGIWVLFDRFNMVQGWTFEEVCILYGIIHIGFSIAESCARGFDTFDRMIKDGEFDRILLRPLGSLFQIATGKIEVMRLGRLIQGSLVLLWAVHDISIDLFWVTALFAMIAGTAALFYAIFILQATLCFWTTESLEMVNITTYGGVEACQYPMSLYPKGFRLIFTLVIPLAAVSYYPTALLLDKESLIIFGQELFTPKAALLFPLAGILFLYLSFRLWRIGERRYTSTGS